MGKTLEFHSMAKYLMLPLSQLKRDYMYRILVLTVLSLTLGFSSIAQSPQNLDQFQFGLDYSTWMNAPDSLGVNTKSVGFHVGLHYDVPIVKNNFTFAPGISFDISSVDLGAFISKENADSATLGNTVFNPVPDTVNYTRNKIVLTTVNVPIEFRLRTNKDKKNNTWKFAAGVKGGINIGSHTKYVGQDPTDISEDIKVKNYQLPNITKFRYGLTGRVGYGNYNLGVYYGLNNVFEDGKAPALNELTISFIISAL